jgi:hypothetical protein
MVDTDRIERIRQRAYEIWNSEGRPLGLDQAHWLRAEAEIDKGFGTQGPKKKPSKPTKSPLTKTTPLPSPPSKPSQRRKSKARGFKSVGYQDRDFDRLNISALHKLTCTPTIVVRSLGLV